MIGYSFRLKEYVASAPSQDMEMHCLPQSQILSLIADCKCNKTLTLTNSRLS